MNSWISWSGLNPHNPSKSVRAMAISGLWFGSLYTWRHSRHKRLFDRNKVAFITSGRSLCSCCAWGRSGWAWIDRALPTLKTCVDQFRLHQTLLRVYISDCLYFKPQQNSTITTPWRGREACRQTLPCSPPQEAPASRWQGRSATARWLPNELVLDQSIVKTCK